MSNLSYVAYTGDGVTNQFLLAVDGGEIGYLRTDDIHVYVNDVEVTFNIETASPHLVILDAAPASGSEVVLRREMPQGTTYSDFSRGNKFGPKNMNNSFQQGLYLTQEILDGYLPEGSTQKQDLNFGGKHAPTNLRAPVEPSDATNKEYVDARDTEQRARLTSLETAHIVSSANDMISYTYHGGSALGGELTFNVGIPFVSVNRLYINGVHQTYGLAWDYDNSLQIVELAEELDTGDEVVVELGVDAQKILDNEVVSSNATFVSDVTNQPIRLGTIAMNSVPIKTIADLRTYNPVADGQVVDVLGHTLAGVGGGQFYYDPDDSTSADNNGTVIVTSMGARWKSSRQGETLTKLPRKKDTLTISSNSNTEYSPKYSVEPRSQGLYLDATGSAYIETGVVVFDLPRRNFDIEFTITRELSGGNVSLFAQNIADGFSERAFHVYFNTTTNSFKFLLGGTEITVDVTGSPLGRWHFIRSGETRVFTVLKEGEVIFTEQLSVNGFVEEPTATFTISSRHAGTNSSYSSAGNRTISDVVLRKNPKKLVVLGASIMNRSFSSPADAITYVQSLGGGISDVTEYAVEGDTIADTLAALPAILLTETEPCLFVMHIGGNDVSQTRPYTTADPERLLALEEGIRNVISTVKSAGHDFALCNLTYREYWNILPDKSNGSLPYNDNIVDPLIREMTPEWWDNIRNRPVLDLYSFIEENIPLISTDGIHLTPEGEVRLMEFILGRILQTYNGSNGGYYIPLDEGPDGSLIHSFDGVSTALTIGNSTPEDWFFGAFGKDLPIVQQEGVGSQVMLKNLSGVSIEGGDEVDASDLSALFVDSAGLWAVSVVALPTGSKWRLVSGGSVPANAAKTFVRIS
mgnify:CR=1 FL=1